jgi:chromosome segregation ATPase
MPGLDAPLADSHSAGQAGGRRGKGKPEGQGMQDIAELERRITVALERIATGLDRAPVAAPQPEGADQGLVEEIARLSEALDEERMANAQLAERLKVVRDKDGKQRAALEDQIADVTRQLQAQGEELDQARQAVAERTAEVQSLRDMAAVSSPSAPEIEAMRAARAAEAAELDDILAVLEPLLAHAAAPTAATEGASDART